MDPRRHLANCLQDFCIHITRVASLQIRLDQAKALRRHPADYALQARIDQENQRAARGGAGSKLRSRRRAGRGSKVAAPSCGPLDEVDRQIEESARAITIELESEWQEVRRCRDELKEAAFVPPHAVNGVPPAEWTHRLIFDVERTANLIGGPHVDSVRLGRPSETEREEAARRIDDLRGPRLDEIPTIAATPEEPAAALVATPAAEAHPRLRVDNDVAILDGTPHSLTADQAKCLKLLIEAEGNWVSSGEMKTTKESKERPDRIIGRLPDPIRALIESQTGKGFRLRPDGLDARL